MNIYDLKKKAQIAYEHPLQILKKYRISVGFILIALGAGIFLFGSGNDETTQEILVLQRRDLVQTVSITGKVKPAQMVDLAFEKGGRISRVYVEVGDRVYAQSPLIALENSELMAQILQAKAKIQELDPARVEKRGSVDLQKLYQQGMADAQDATVIAKSSLLTLSDIQYAYFTGNSIESMRLADAKTEAVRLLLGEENAGRWLAEFLSPLKGGIFGNVQDSFQSIDPVDSAEVLKETLEALQATKKALDAVVMLSSFTEAQKSSLSSAKNSVSAAISALVQDIQGIAVQNVENENALESQKAQYNSATATLQEFEAQLAKTVLRSPLAGIVTKKDGNQGEIVSSGATILSLISESQFEIESYVPEADIAKISVGNEALLDLDAYGSSLMFRGKVVFIDPAETMIDGVSTYKITTHFLEKDDRIKSGMTANLDITGQKREGVLAVPQRSVTTRDGKKFVKTLIDEVSKEVEVRTGFRGSDGYIEIVDGLQEGNTVIVFSEK